MYLLQKINFKYGNPNLGQSTMLDIQRRFRLESAKHYKDGGRREIYRLESAKHYENGGRQEIYCLESAKHYKYGGRRVIYRLKSAKH